MNLNSKDFKCPQMTSEAPSPSIETVRPKKNKMKRGGNDEIKDELLDETLYNHNP